MTLASGLGSQFGMKKETTWGTAVTVDKFIEFDTESLSLDRAYVDGVGLKANRTFAPSGRTKATTRQADGDVVFQVPTKLFGALLDLAVQPTVTPVQQAATIAYLSTFSVGASQPTKSATLQVNKPTSQAADSAHTYPGGVLASMAFSLAVGGVLMCTTSWHAADETTPSTTPAGAALATASYATGVTTWAHNEVATLTINGVAAAAISSINWTWTQPYKGDRFFLGTTATRAKPIPNGYATVTGSFNCEWYDTAYYDLYRSGAFVAIVCKVEGATIASTYKETLTNTFAACQIRGESAKVAGPDVLETNVPFVVKDDGTNAPWKAEYLSTDSTAW